jgi:hypothetical protein
METVKFDEGTKFETSLDLQDDEGVIFVRPIQNKMIRHIDSGCLWTLLTFITLGLALIFKPKQTWQANFVITSQRVVSIPLPPNKKNFPVESFYFSDISKVKAVKQDKASDEASSANFTITMKPTGKSSIQGNIITFMVCMAMTAKNWFNAFKAEVAEGQARNASVMNASLAAMDYQHYTKKSVDKYYAEMERRAKERAANMDFSKAGHAQVRDFIVDLINTCVEEVNK